MGPGIAMWPGRLERIQRQMARSARRASAAASAHRGSFASTVAGGGVGGGSALPGGRWGGRHSAAGGWDTGSVYTANTAYTDEEEVGWGAGGVVCSYTS